jgi:predicted nucleotidyltransferase
MKQRVLEELTRIERTGNIRILLAVESGSRAWGFASPDSDFDVRFIYVHAKEWYLSIFEGRDVIEEMLPGNLDVSGWDLRKTLRLFSRCNCALNEWLGSPITYSEVPGFRRHLAELIPQYFNPIGAIHHYRKIANGALADNLVDGRIGIKKLFYVLRPLLACRWIERQRSQPPTEFAKLTAPDWVSPDERAWIADLLAQKSAAAEAHPIPLDEKRVHDLRSELERYASATELVEAAERSGHNRLDDVLRTWI